MPIDDTAAPSGHPAALPAADRSRDLSNDLFMAVHTDLPREAPGSRRSTWRALQATGMAGQRVRVLDIACGPGAQTLDLAAALPDAQLVACDLHPPYLAEVGRRAAQAGCAARVRTVRADMAALPFTAGEFDLVWCEGGAYIIGVTRALQRWRPLLAPGGRIALTDAVWLRDERPAPARAFWAEYPAMQPRDAALAAMAQCGCRVIDHFVLPDHDWFDDYYTPMQQRIDALRDQHGDDPVARKALDDCALEVDIRRRYGDCYGYLFAVLEPAPPYAV